MQFQVPQFIETEDKVVGPFSLRQFAFVGVACLISAVFYFTVATWLAIFIGIILIGSALALSFVKVEGRPLMTIVLAAFNFYWKPQTYVWQPEETTLPKAAKKSIAKSSGASFEDILSGILKKKWDTVSETSTPAAAESIATGSSLHKSWQSVQTGEASKTSDRQFVEKRMNERYQIFQRLSGDRAAAKRIDYR